MSGKHVLEISCLYSQIMLDYVSVVRYVLTVNTVKTLKWHKCCTVLRYFKSFELSASQQYFPGVCLHLTSVTPPPKKKKIIERTAI